VELVPKIGVGIILGVHMIEIDDDVSHG